MAIIAGQVIRQAYLLASVLGIEQEPNGFYATTGLIYLNQVLSQWGKQNVYVPYTSILTVNVQPNVYTYLITPVIIEIQQGNIQSSDTVLSNLNFATAKEANLFNYASGVGPSRPQSLFLSQEQVFPDPASSQLGSKLLIYPNPDQAYTMTLMVKYQLPEVTLFETMINLPPYYFEPLVYELAKKMINFFKTIPAATFNDDYEKLMLELKSSTPQDMTIQVDNDFMHRRPFKPWGYLWGPYAG